MPKHIQEYYKNQDEPHKNQNVSSKTNPEKYAIIPYIDTVEHWRQPFSSTEMHLRSTIRIS